jgi:hypothetical protein
VQFAEPGTEGQPKHLQKSRTLGVPEVVPGVLVGPVEVQQVDGSDGGRAQRLELSVGDATCELTPAEVRDIFARLVGAS